jgi:8-oxo-dGTP pyrophosphatase MutT (NUDIX family)
MKLDSVHDVVSALQARLAPSWRACSMVDQIEGARPAARRAAVLLPLFEHNGMPTLAFIRRSSTLRAHSGEIAFPGGSVDAADADPAAAALREAQEEIGLEPQRVQVLGVLPPVFTVVSNFLITPVVAFLPQGLGDVNLQCAEVAELLLIPLQGLANPVIAHTEQWSRYGTTRTIYFYDYGPYRIWGATGRILNTLLSILQKSELHGA